jgi:hypothetical protein
LPTPPLPEVTTMTVAKLSSHKVAIKRLIKFVMLYHITGEGQRVR